MARMRNARLAVLAAALAVVATGCSFSATQPAGTVPAGTRSNADWMSSTFADHPNVALGQILIPGTHDSGTAAIDVSPPCEHSFNTGESKLSQLGGVVSPCMVTGMARTQTQSLGEQLENGIRYLDLRVGVPQDQVVNEADLPTVTQGNVASVPLILQHVLVSQPLVQGLDEITRFAARHPKEQVILDFQRLDLPNSSPAILDYYRKALDLLLQTHIAAGASDVRPICQSAWSSDVVRVSDRELARKVTIGQAWAANRNLIVLLDPGQLPNRPCYRDRSAAILSPWPNTESPTVSADVNHQELLKRQPIVKSAPVGCVDGDRQNWCGFFVNQMQLSISPGTQKRCVVWPDNDCSLFVYSQLVNNDVADYVQQWRESEGLPVNIVIVDYYNYSEPQIADTMILLNQKLLAR